MENNQTAVQWLIQQVNSDCLNSTFIRPDLIKKAEQMEKEQLLEARNDMQIKCVQLANDFLTKINLQPVFELTPEDNYYEEKFKS